MIACEWESCEVKGRGDHLKRIVWKDRLADWLDFNWVEGWLRTLKRLWYHLSQRMDWNLKIESMCQYPSLHHWKRSASPHPSNICSKRRQIHWLPSFEIYNQMAWHSNLWTRTSNLNVTVSIHHNQTVTLLHRFRNQRWSWRHETLAWKLHWVWPWEHAYTWIFVVQHIHHLIWWTVCLQVCASSWR